jgi:1-phosphofructokinase family hexose kinase
MIITVTLNTALDHTLFVRELTPNTTVRAYQSMISVAGKATDVSWVLSELGEPNLAMGFAAGRFGRQMELMLQQKGVDTSFVWVGGETRLNTVIVGEDHRPQTTITTDTLEVTPEHLAFLRTRFCDELPRASAVVISGSLPHGIAPSFYAELIRLANRQSVPVILDASGQALLDGLDARPAVIKPNLDELSFLAGRPLSSLAEVRTAAEALQVSYGAVVVATLADNGAIAVLPGKAYQIPALSLKVASPAGAGDAVVAGLAAALARHEPFETGLRLGFAAAGAVVMMPGTADCHRQDIDTLFPLVELITLV